MNNATQTRNQIFKLNSRQVAIGAISTLVGIGLVFGAFHFYPLLQADSSEGQIIEEAEPLPVNLMTLEQVDSIQLGRMYTGMIRARQRSQLGFELAGQIANVFVDEGQRIEKGQPIAQLDTAQLDARKKSIEAQLEQARSVLEELEAGPRIERIKSAKADVASATSQYENARLRLERRRLLLQSKAILKEEFQQAKYDEETRRAQLDAAQKKLDELENGTRSEKISAQQATVDSLEASRDEIDVSINKSTLRAPYTATVSERYLDPGSIASPSLAVVKLVEDDHLEAWIGLPVEIAMDLKIGQPYELVVDGNEIGSKVAAKIAEVDQRTRTQIVIFKLSAQDSGQVVSGQLCKVSINSTFKTEGFWVPTSALNKGIRGLWSVMMVAPDESGTLRTQKRDITIARTDAKRVFVEGTVAAGTQIVADGVHKITPGQAVSDASIKQ